MIRICSANVVARSTRHKATAIAGAIAALSMSTISFAEEKQPAEGEYSAQGAALDPKLQSVTESMPHTDFYAHSLSVYASHDMKYSPKPVSDVYLEYEYYGRQGGVELYGYIDTPKIFGIGNENDHGAWDDGSPLFMEHEPRISIDSMLDRSLSVGLLKEFYLAFDWTYDHGDSRKSRSNILWSGFGVDIDTHSRLNLAANIYAKRAFENYSQPTEYSWDGYRVKFKYDAPLAEFSDGSSLSFIGYVTYDFDSKLPDYYGDVVSDDSAVMANRIAYIKDHLLLTLSVYNFWNGGNFVDGKELDFGDGPFKADSSGTGYTLSVGYNF